MPTQPPGASTAAASSAPASWTSRALLAWMTQAFTKSGLDAPRLMSELLLAHALGVQRLTLYTEPDRPATPDERDRLRALVQRALRHEPVQHLTNQAWFFSLPFFVDRRALIPRPSTETILEHLLQHARPRRDTALALADVCTGSGCVAVALLKNLPNARCVATDLSPQALEVARINAERHGVLDRIDLLQGDLLDPLLAHPGGAEVDYLTANPPYIPDAEWPEVGPNVRDHEPELALRGGTDGLRLVRPLLERGPERLRPGGLLLVEIAAATAEAALAIARDHPLLEHARVAPDHEGLPRVVIAARRGG